MTTEWDNSPSISREAWREHARELDRLLAAERAVNAACQQAIDAVDAESARLRAWGERFEQSFYDTSSKAAEYRAEIARLRQIIRDYAGHNEGCSAAHGDQYRCRCGWRDVERDFLKLNSQ